MRYLSYIALPALLLGTTAATAQDIPLAYNLSNLTVQGTARSMGFGNALGSVGGDFSSLSVNPAGLGVYRMSELTFTPSLRMGTTNSQYLGTITPDNNVRFNINNFGMVFTDAPKGRRYDRRNWKSVSFAFGMNRSADYSRNYTYVGKNSTSSGSLVFESDANYDPASAYSTEPTTNTPGYIGFQSYLLNRTSGGNFYTIVPFQGGVNQLRSVQEKGGVNEYTLAVGGNYKEQLMIGATLGIPSFNYRRTTTFTETLSADNNAPNPSGFQTFTYNQNLDISGAGINLKLGAIYKVNDMFRIGAAFHSPTYYSVTDIATPMLSVTHNDSLYIISQDNGYTMQNQFDYSMTSPWRGILSATMLFDKVGFITFDYEYVGYNAVRYQFPAGVDAFGYTFQQAQDYMNQEIKKSFQGASNFRLGGEIKLSKFFMARAGMGYYGNAYTPYGQSNASGFYNTDRIDLSTGVGFRFDNFFVDLGFVHRMYEGFERPYSVDYSTVISGSEEVIPGAKINYNISNAALTFGVKF